MTYETAIAQLRNARNGAEMLQVLNQLMSPEAPQTATATLEPMEF